MAGESVQSLVKSTGKSKHSVYRIIKRFGALTPSDKFLTDEEKKRIINSFVGGDTYETLVAKFGRHRGVLVKTIKESDIDVRAVCRQHRSRGRREYSVNESYFSKIETEQQAWILGFIAGDGNVSLNQHKTPVLAINIAWKDHEIVERIKNEIQYTGPVYKTKSKYRCGDYFYACIRVVSHQICGDLAIQGIHPRKSLTLMPWDGPSHLMRHYWRGVIDADGSLCRANDEEWRLCLAGSKAMVEGLKIYCHQITGTKSQAKQGCKAKSWQIQFGGNKNVRSLVSHFYSDAKISLPRKQNLAQMIIEGMPPYKSRRLQNDGQRISQSP
jgi:hypothetical protein